MTKPGKSAKETNEQKWRRMRLIKDKLQENGAMSSSEVELLFSEPADDKILKRSVQNYLAELVFLDVGVKYDKEARRYVWSENKRVLSPEENERRIEHSRKLIPAFADLRDGVAPAIGPTGYSESPFAEQHLKKGYPEIYQKLEKYREARTELEKKLIQKWEAFEKVFKGQASRYGLDPEQPSASRFVTFYANWKPKPEEAPEEASLKEELRKELGKDEKNFQESYWSLSGAIWDLTHRIEHGVPLEGSCDICRRFPMLKQEPENKAS